MYPEPQSPYFSFRGFAFLIAFCVLCFNSAMPHNKPSTELWHVFIALMVFSIFLEVWQIRNPRPCHEPEKTEEE